MYHLQATFFAIQFNRIYRNFLLFAADFNFDLQLFRAVRILRILMCEALPPTLKVPTLNAACLYLCIGVSLYRCTGVLVYRCIGVSVYRYLCIGMSVYWCINVLSMHDRCIIDV